MVEFRNMPPEPVPEGCVRVTVEGRLKGAIHRADVTVKLAGFLKAKDRPAYAEAVAKGAADAFMEAFGKSGKR